MYAHAPIAFHRPGLVFAVLLHGLVLWGVWQAKMITPPLPLAVLTVSMITPAPEVSRAEPAVVPPLPRPVPQPPKPVLRPSPARSSSTQLVVPADTPHATTHVAPHAVPSAPTFSAPAPVSAPAAPAAPPSAPRFDADYLDNPRPPYPSLSRRLGEQGRVVLRVRVLASGQAEEVQLHSSSGYSRLDQSAMETVRRWKFVPARSGNEALAAWVLVPIAFTLKE